MIIKSSAPCRISLFGSGTDIDPYASLFGGVCLSMAINLRQEIVFDDSLPESLIPKGADWKFYDKFFEMLDYRPKHFRADFDGEITGGIGSSAAAAVALVGAIAKARDIKYDRDEVARVAWNVEVNGLKMFGGRQDQWAAAHGGVNVFEFMGDKVITTPLSPEFIKPILPSLMLFHTGKNRKNPKIQENFKELTDDQIQYLDAIKGLVPEAIKAIGKGKVKTFAELLDLSWEYKKMSNRGVSNDEIDGLFDKAKKCGALAGKVCGAGESGYVLFVVEPEKQKLFKEKIGLKWMDWDVSWDGLSVRRID